MCAARRVSPPLVVVAVLVASIEVHSYTKPLLRGDVKLEGYLFHRNENASWAAQSTVDIFISTVSSPL